MLSRPFSVELATIRAELKKQDLLQILESFPSVASSSFRSTPSLSSTALFLGYRNSCTDTSEEWAHIKPGCGLTPPVEIRDEITTEDGKRKTWPRSTASLLRTPGLLKPPFCFLRYYEKSTAKRFGVRNMLCAVVLYYALAAGASDQATKWSGFQECLEEAMRFINWSAAYHEWLDRNRRSSLAARKESGGSGANKARGTERAVRRTANTTTKTAFDGVIVHSLVALEKRTRLRNSCSVSDTKLVLQQTSPEHSPDHSDSSAATRSSKSDDFEPDIYCSIISGKEAVVTGLRLHIQKEDRSERGAFSPVAVEEEPELSEYSHKELTAHPHRPNNHVNQLTCGDQIPKRRGSPVYENLPATRKSPSPTDARTNQLQRSPHSWRSTVPPWAVRESSQKKVLPARRPWKNPYENFTLDQSVPRLGEFFLGEQDDADKIKKHSQDKVVRDSHVRRKLGLPKRDPRYWLL